MALSDGTRASVGDWVVTRKNDRRLRTLRSGWVRNGDRWTVTAVHDDGSLVVRRQGKKRGGAIVLPAGYVAEHVDLGYAITAHRAQGLTVDTAHVVVFDNTTRENLYVAMTRGREHNHAYVIVDTADDNHAARPGEDATAKAVLRSVLANSGTELSAHQMITAEQGSWTSIAQLVAEYDTIAVVAQHDRWARLIRSCALTPEQADTVIESEAFGPLAAELRRVEANGYDIERLLPAAVARYGLDHAKDVAAVLHHRLALATQSVATGRMRSSTKLIVGLIPEALGPMPSDMREALDERRVLIEQRARAVVTEAEQKGACWVRRLGRRPVARRQAEHWDRALATVAAYRDRYGISSPQPLGGDPTTESQRLDRAIAIQATRTMSTNQLAPPVIATSRDVLGL